MGNEEPSEISARESREQTRQRRRLERAERKKKRRAEREAKQRRLLFPADKKGRHVMHLMNFLRVLFYPIHWLLYPFRLYGNKKIGTGPYIYVSNHYCIWDVFYPAHTTWEGVHFLAKDSIMHAPIIGSWARRLGVIGAMRDGSDVRTIMDAMKVLKNGEKIALFPKGRETKSPMKNFFPFTAGRRCLPSRPIRPSCPLSSAIGRIFSA